MKFERENGIKVAGVELNDRSLIRMGWLLPLLTVFSSMTVHAFSGNARDIPFFISEADYPGLERWIFTTGLTLSGIILCIIANRFKTLFTVFEKPKMQRFSFLAGLTTGTSLVVLAFANMYDVLALHCVFAILVFGGGLAWGGSTHLLLDSKDREQRTLRRVAFSLALLGFVIMNTAITGYIVMNRSKLSESASLSTRLNDIQAAIDFAAPAEYLLFLGLVLTLASFDSDVKSIQSTDSNE